MIYLKPIKKNLSLEDKEEEEELSSKNYNIRKKKKGWLNYK